MIGHKIKNHRKVLNLSIRKLSKQSNVSVGYISNMENGKLNNPSIEIMSRIAAALGISTSDLIEEKNDAKN